MGSFYSQWSLFPVLNPANFVGKEIPLPNLTNTVVPARWLHHAEVGDLRVNHTLEGDPYWGLLMPANPGNKLSLTVDVETAEVNFQ